MVVRFFTLLVLTASLAGVLSNQSLGPESGSGMDYSGSASGSLRPMEPEENTQVMPNMTTAAADTSSFSTDPESTNPEVTEPESTNPEVTEPESTNPEATEPESTNPEATEPESTNPDNIIGSGTTNLAPLGSGSTIFEPTGSSESESTTTGIIIPEPTGPESTNTNTQTSIMLQFTFELTEGDEFNEDAKEELVGLLQQLLDLESTPKLSVNKKGSVVEVLVDLGLSEERTSDLATLLLTSTDSQWLTFRDAYNLTSIQVVMEVRSSEIPWWHWLIIAIIATNTLAASILLTTACCCRCWCKSRSIPRTTSLRETNGRQRPSEMELRVTTPQYDAQQRKMQVRKVSQLSLLGKLDHGYYNSHLLSVDELEGVVSKPASLFSEFVTVPPNLVSMAEVPSGAEDKNRYNNVLPNMATRVALFLKFGVPNSDYINANYIRGHGNQPKSYIATQGPLQWTAADFWRMVWEQQSSTIVMVTNLNERGRSKCVRYWPEEERSHRASYEDIEIILKRRTTQQNYTITIFLLRHKEKMVSREVVHFWFTAWPDHGVPSSCQDFLEFLLLIHKHIGDMPGPTVVHCSAGIGRTGVLVGADVGLRQLDESGEVDVLKILSSLRRDRGGMIQTKEQYLFLHQVLLEYAKKKFMMSTPHSGQAFSIPEEADTDLDNVPLIN